MMKGGISLKRKGVGLPLIISLGMITLAVITAFIDPSDITGSVMIGFFALAPAIETFERIRYNSRLARYRQDALKAVKYRYSAYANTYNRAE